MMVAEGEHDDYWSYFFVNERSQTEERMIYGLET